MRIVSLISSGTEILFALGLGQHVVAVSHECDYPPAARELSRVTRSWIDSSRSSGEIDEQVKNRFAAGQPLYAIDAKLLCRLAPDLIVTQAQCDVCAVRHADVVDLVQSRRELRHTLVLALNPQSLEDVLADICRIGQATESAAAADDLESKLNLRVDRIAGLTNKLLAADRPRVFCAEWIEPLMAAGNWTPRLIELAGGRSGLATAGSHSSYVTWADVRLFDSEVLLIAPCGFDLARSQAEAERLWRLPGFGALAAVRGGRAFVVDGNAYLNRSGPRLVESLELLAHLIQPSQFPPPGGALSEFKAWSRLAPPLHG